MYHSCEAANSGVLAHVILKLTSLAKQSVHIASTMYSQGLGMILLCGLKKMMSSSADRVQCGVEQRLMLDLFLIISQHAISSVELKSFLELFKEKSAPMVSF